MGLSLNFCASKTTKRKTKDLVLNKVSFNYARKTHTVNSRIKWKRNTIIHAKHTQKNFKKWLTNAVYKLTVVRSLINKYGTDITGNEVFLQSKQHSFIIAEYKRLNAGKTGLVCPCCDCKASGHDCGHWAVPIRKA